jgi:hypothetical protein
VRVVAAAAEVVSSAVGVAVAVEVGEAVVLGYRAAGAAEGSTFRAVSAVSGLCSAVAVGADRSCHAG